MKPATNAKILRCAIYTRKSSEEGLDQAFNSLHAQREACEAYVKSQAHEGWRLLPALYDDGGFSGGTLERPALKQLLADVDASKIDVVVVYKVDRLTRALADFAKIVERLDAANASFVSVTQAFNTTSSMGRLTLNVLLSFAQFEREVTGERIRDKIAQSKAKGMWMGGPLPLGYDAPNDPATRALVVNEAEAEQVRLIFQRYLELGCVSALAAWLDANDVRSKAYLTKRGRPVGGVTFSRGALFHLLKNRTYLGEIPHKKLSYPGAHPGIIGPDVFAAVQTMMAANTRRHHARPTRSATMALKGLIFDADGDPMSPSFVHRRGDRLYRYYVSAPLLQGSKRLKGDRAIRRVPAQAVEAVVEQALARITRRKISPVPRRVEVCEQELHLLVDASSVFPAHADEDVELERVRRALDEGSRVTKEAGEGGLVRIVLPIRLRPRGGKTWALAPDGRAALPTAGVDTVLVNALRTGHRLARECGLVSGAAGTESGSVTKSPASFYDRRLCQLAFLAPDIQHAILEGRQPPGLKLARFIEQPPPMAWDDQRRAFGFAIGTGTAA